MRIWGSTRLIVLFLMVLAGSVQGQIPGGGGTPGTGAGTGGSFGSGSQGKGGTFGSNSIGTGANLNTIGGTTPGAGNVGTGATGMPSSANPFRNFYATPQAQGMRLKTMAATAGAGTTSTTATFGQPIYGNLSGAAGTTAGGLGATPGLRTGSTPGALGGATLGTTGNRLGTTGLGSPGLGSTGLGMGTGIGATRQTANGFSTNGIPPSTRYVTTPGFTPTPTSSVRTPLPGLQQILMRSSALANPGAIQVLQEDAVIVLRGQVGTDRERRLAESILRLTPGVREVRNELVLPSVP